MREVMMVNKNTDDEAGKLAAMMGGVAGEDTALEILGKLDSIQQSILAGFAALHSEYMVFIQDGEFIVPENIYEISVYACAAGGEVYAGESIIGEKFSVTPGEVIPIVVGDAQTEIGEYKYLIEANSELDSNTDTLGIGVVLGIKGGDGSKNASYCGSAGVGGHGGAFGFGGGGGGAGCITMRYGGNTSYHSGYGGTAHTEEHPVYFNGVLFTFEGAVEGENAARCDPSYATSQNHGGYGGDAGGFGAGGGTGGAKGGYLTYPDESQIQYGSNKAGANGKGSQGIVFIRWGVDA